MSYWEDYKSRVNKYFTFAPAERNALILSIIVIGFIVSFVDWETSIFLTVRNIFNGIIIAALVLLIHETGSRLWAIHLGFKQKIELWWPGLISGLLLVMASNGFIWFIPAPGIFVEHHPTHRLGHFRYGLNMAAKGWICLVGIGSVLAFAILCKILLFYMPGNILLKKALIVSLWFSVVNMLPIPPLNGTRVFFMAGSPLGYIFTTSLVIGFAIFLMLPITHLWHMWLLLLGALIIGTGGWLYYLNTYHSK